MLLLCLFGNRLCQRRRGTGTARPSPRRATSTRYASLPSFYAVAPPTLFCVVQTPPLLLPVQPRPCARSGDSTSTTSSGSSSQTMRLLPSASTQTSLDASLLSESQRSGRCRAGASTPVKLPRHTPAPHAQVRLILRKQCCRSGAYNRRASLLLGLRKGRKARARVR